ncbi:MAG: ATP-dependent helicase [Chitinispirillaceae bacterium]|nr:ATP-dependent helicase [Chitinispirillaceae bacterium]
MFSSDRITEGLNEEQRRAVTAPIDCHYLVLAGAGCGKTTVLTRRIAYLALGGVPLPRILALTFTRKAAEEMAVRVGRLAEEEQLPGRPTIATFHAFALKVLGAEYEGGSNFSRIGFTGRVHCINEEKRLALLAQCCSAGERSSLEADILKLDSMIERLNVFPESINVLPPAKAEALRIIVRRFKERKRVEGAWDFSDLIDGVVELFEHTPTVLAYYRHHYTAVLVDEFQDTNPVQIRLLHHIVHTGHFIFAVGDDDQAIYGFRGADVGPTLSFANHFLGAEIIKLQTNYRSVPAILSKANRIFRHKDPAYRKLLVSGKYPERCGIAPSIHHFIDQKAMADWIMTRAKACAIALQVPPCAMAALFRVNQTAGWVGNYLSGRGIPEEGRPQLLTVHKSKGLEFPVVFLCDMEEGVFPSYRERKGRRIRTVTDFIHALLNPRRKSIECDWDEERRLFYVAITRAQQRLFFLVARQKQVYGRNRRFEPSRYLRLIR